MADEIVSGNGQGDHIMGLGLDIKDYIQQLQAALEAYNVFSNKFSKTLSIRVDPQSLNALSNAFGIQMRQAVGLIKGAQKETVQQSAEMVKQVNSEFKKISGFEAFKELSKKARKAKEDTKKELTELADAAKQIGEATGNALASGVKKGADGAKSQLAEINAAAQAQIKSQQALAKGQLAEAEKYSRMLAQSISDYGKKLGTPDGADRIRELSGVNPQDIPERVVDGKKGQKVVVDQERVLSMLRQIQDAYAELSQAEGQYLDRGTSLYERAIARVDRLRREFEKLPEAARAVYATLRQQKDLAELAEPDVSAARVGRTPYGQLGTAEDLTRQIFVEDSKGTLNERNILAERKFQAELAMMREAKQKAIEIQRDADAAEKKLLDQGLRATAERIATEKAHYRQLRDEQKNIAKDANDAERKLLRQAAETVSQKIATEKAHYRHLRDEQKKIAKDANDAERKLLSQAEKTIADRVATEKAHYRHLRDERKRIAREIQKDADEAERRILEKAKQTLDEKIAAAKAYYRNLREEEKRAAQANRGLAQFQNQQVLAAGRADSAAAAANARVSRIASSTGLRFQNIEASEFLDKNGLIDRSSLNEVNRLTRAAISELAEYQKELDERNRIIKENANNERRIDAALERAKAKAPELADELDRRAAALRSQLRAVPAIPTAGPAIASLAARFGQGERIMADGRIETRPALPSLPSRISTADLDNASRLSKHYSDAKKEAQGLFEVQRGIGASVLQQGTNMIKWLFLYKAVHEVTRLIQTGLRTFVDSGVEYTRQLETQQLALRAILAENFEITDNQGQQLQGMAALSALQGESRRQWGQIQQASLAVVGTTSDLMTLYAGILPFAAQLGADLQEVQDLTKGAAVAASLLDVSFQDARSAMISLLQGRALTRNRLVGALGFTKEEIESVSGEERLALIRSRLEEFILSADEAQETLAALSESFKDFTGIVASGFTTPFTNMFKEFVKGLTDSTKSWSIFEKTVNGTGLQLKGSLKAFIDFSRTAMGNALQPLRDFGREITKQNSNDLKQWVIGASEIAKAAISVSIAITKAGISLTTFIAQNRELLKFLASVAAISVGVNIFLRLGAAFTAAAKEGGLLVSVLRLLTGVSLASNTAATGMAGAATVATSHWDRLFTSIKTVATFAKFSIITSAIAFLTQKFFQLKQQAESAQAAIEAMRRGDVQQTILHAQEGFASGDPAKMKASADAVIGVTNRVFDRASKFFGGDITVENAVKTQQRFKKELSDLEKQRSENQERIAKLITDGDGNLTKQQLAEITKLREENAKIRGQIKDKNTERNQIFAELESTVSILAEQPNIFSTVKALNDPAQRFFGNLLKQVDQFGIAQFNPDGTPKRHEDGTQVRGHVTVPGIGVGTRLALGRGLQLPGKAPAVPTLPDAKALQDQWNQKVAQIRTLSSVVGAFEDEDQPLFNFRGLPDSGPDQADRWSGQADPKIRQLEARVAVEKSLHEKAVAHRMETQAEADAAIEKMERDLLAKKISLYEADAESYEKYVQNKIKEKKPLDADTVASQRESNKAKIEEAKKEFAVLVNTQDAAEARRIRAFEDELREGLLGLSKFSAEIYGTVEDTALASFDKNIENIRQKLEQLKFNPEQQAVIDAFLKRAAAVRPAIGDMSRIESSIKVNEKRLGVSRDEEALLMKQFEIGEIGASKYLSRIREIRATQVEILEQLEAAFLARAGQKEIGLISETDPEKLAHLKTEIAQFRAQAAQARAQIADILDSARRVEAAIQSWANLTSQFREFLAAADGLDGTNTGLETMIDSLHVASNLLDRIVASAHAFGKLGSTFNQFKALFADADGGNKIGGSFRALGGLLTGGLSSLFGGGQQSIPIAQGLSGFGLAAGGTVQQGLEGAGAAGQVTTAGQKFAAALPAIGIGISAALTFATALFNRGVEKAKRDIEKSFEKINKGLNNGTITLGKAIEQAEKERQRLVDRYSDSKSGRKALKEMLPQIDDQIEAMRQRAKDIQKNFDDAFKQLVDLGGNTMKPGPFTDFAHELMELEKFFREYLDSINTATTGGADMMRQALEKVNTYYEAFLENAKARFGEELLSFEGEALSAQERVFSLINTQDGLYKQLHSIAEDRLDLEEAIQEEMERREDAQNKLNDLAKKELEIRKRIAEIIRQAAEDELAIRRRGVLEAQLSVAQQKAMEISNVRHRAQEEIDKLKEELAGLQDDIQDETKANAKKDRDFDRRRQALADREADIRREMQLNDIRLRGARAVAAIQGEIFGLATDEFDLAERQNELAIKQAEIQVQKWRETQALFQAIVEGAEGFKFEPPEGFPLIKVELGSITIDNRDESTNTFNTPAGPPVGARPRPPGAPDGGRARPRTLSESSEAANTGNEARQRGYGDIDIV